MDEDDFKWYLEEIISQLRMIAMATMITMIIIAGVTAFVTYKYVDTSIKVNKAVDNFNESLEGIGWGKP